SAGVDVTISHVSPGLPQTTAICPYCTIAPTTAESSLMLKLSRSAPQSPSVAMGPSVIAVALRRDVATRSPEPTAIHSPLFEIATIDSVDAWGISRSNVARLLLETTRR